MFVFRVSGLTVLLFLLLASSVPAVSLDGNPGGQSLQAQFDVPESDLLEAVQEVIGDQIIHGTQQYAKEKVLYGAHSAESSSAFRESHIDGKVFYKVAENVLSPQFFKDSNDLGTIAIRYIIRAINPTSTALQIDAVFLENDHRRVHQSEGVVESAEFAEIQKRLDALNLRRKEAHEERKKLDQLQAEDNALALAGNPSSGTAGAANSAVQDLERRVTILRRQAERRVKDSETPLRSAPFRSATTIASLPAQTEVLIVVITPYWYGVETQDGRRGWIHHSQLEMLP
ncbi:MAG TPA: SH3 domain-containing protein [Terriglobales bacterium]|nr:SH3 domain-containing protein [Terriglobales bacterium]